MCPDGVDIRQDKFCCKIPPAVFNYPPRKSPQELIWSLRTLSLRLTPKGDRWSSCPTQRGCGWVEKFHSRGYSGEWNVSARRTQPVLMEAVHPAQLSLPQAHGTSGLALTLGLWGDSLTAVG